MKSVLTYFGRRAAAFGIENFRMVGAFSEKDYFDMKIKDLVERFEIGTIILGSPKISLSYSTTFKCNVFRINRPIGFLPDKIFLKNSIKKEKFTNLKSVDETSCVLSLEDKLEADFIEFHFVEHVLEFSDDQKRNISMEINGCKNPESHEEADKADKETAELFKFKQEQQELNAEWMNGDEPINQVDV